MTTRLPIDERLETAGQLIVRARVFYDIWWFYESAETRPTIIDTMKEYSEFFRFDPHAHFVSFIVHIAALLEKRNDTITLPSLANEMKASGLISTQEAAKADALLGQATPLASKVVILRSNLFAHRSAALSYSEAFKTADVTPNELRDLTDIALKIVNCLLIVRGLKDHVFNTLPLTDAEAILKALGQHDVGDTQ